MKKLLLPLVFGAYFLSPNMQTQAQELPKLGIQQDATKAQIEYKINKAYGLDEKGVKFGIFPKDTSSTDWGSYSSLRDYLRVNYYRIRDFCIKNSQDFDSTLDAVMKHELGHYHTDKIRERLGLNQELDDPFFGNVFGEYLKLLVKTGTKNKKDIKEFNDFVDEKYITLTDLLLERIVNEGIASYYQYPSLEPFIGKWPSSIREVKDTEEYERQLFIVGWNLVYPIISEYGDKGIECVLKNMPKYENFSDLKGYQRRVLEELAKENHAP